MIVNPQAPTDHRRLRLLLWLLVALRFVLPFLLQSPVYEPHRDELLYLAEGDHPAWGFMEVPPVTSLFAMLARLFGSSLFAVKCWPALLAAVTYFLIGDVVIRFRGGYFALALSWLCFALSGFIRASFLFQPVVIEIFFWTLCAYALVRFQLEEKNKWLYLFGIAVGFGFLTKYSMLFYLAGLAAGLLLTPRLFRNPHLWLAAGVALLIFLPNLLWQWRHHWPVIYHMNELRRTQLQYVNPFVFLIEQVSMSVTWGFVWICGIIFCWTKAGRSARFAAVAWLVTVLLFLSGKGKGYYTAGAYPILFALGAVGIERWTSKLQWVRWAITLIPGFLAIRAMPLLMPVYPPSELAAYYPRHHLEKMGGLRWEDQRDHPLPQDFSDMLGWKEMTEKSARAWRMLTPAEQKQTIIFCDNYGQAGAITYYHQRYGIPPAYSANASFLYWLPDSVHVTNLLLVTDDENEMKHPFIRNFQSATVIDSVTTPLARERGDLIILMKGANEDFNRMFMDKLRRERAKTSPR